MIGRALVFVVAELNAHLRRLYQQERDLVILGPLVGSDGVPTSEAANAAVLSVSNITQELVARNQPRTQTSGGVALHVRRPLEMIVHVLIAGGLKRYDTGLTLLSSIVARLHETAVFDPQTSPQLPAGITRLAFSMLNLDYAQQSHLWGGIGAKYVPSVLYEMRMMTISVGHLSAVGPLVAETTASATSSP